MLSTRTALELLILLFKSWSRAPPTQRRKLLLGLAKVCQIGYRMGGKIRKRDRLKTKKKTCSTWDSLVVTHPTTNQAACGLSTAERTGSPVFHTLWPHVLDVSGQVVISQWFQLDTLLQHWI
ncbi:hypothetical protein T310_5687 [Rasamsonia emersonii CBS 393.64]|uniref:Secreted protein n=1 Tax=Rasamsonia emersonii (strain ATCC 16479 / CBS 393.64 / IMI 116815) TaxID=1408163 RepID=A0A0F4YRP8_RASE3|nr:hypothetical protein T310_5687 [Rasamsonia emersonii CBS 393.64]KKA20288.1 hypothetical protein T310_5687 [Rasamsonia emersonii CBS 393.64]